MSGPLHVHVHSITCMDTEHCMGSYYVIIEECFDCPNFPKLFGIFSSDFVACFLIFLKFFPRVNFPLIRQYVPGYVSPVFPHLVFSRKGGKSEEKKRFFDNNGLYINTKYLVRMYNIMFFFCYSSIVPGSMIISLLHWLGSNNLNLDLDLS